MKLIPLADCILDAFSSVKHNSMRQATLSPESDYSLLSSLDALSLSTGVESRRPSSGSGRSSEYENILVPSVSALRSNDPNGSHYDQNILLGVDVPNATTPTKTKRTRRSGMKNRMRQEKLQGPTRDQVQAVIGSQAWDLDSEDGASLLLDDDESVGTSEGQVNSMLGRGSGTTGSVLSMEDAVSSIDDFFEEPQTFMSTADNKLKLWQSLCVELGVARPPVDVAAQNVAPDSPSSSRSVTPTGSRAATPTPGDRPTTPTGQLVDVPASLRQCHALLKTVHINLVDYLERRQVVREALSTGDTGVPIGYKDLLFPSMSALRRYTIKHQKFAKLDTVKSDWLTPLLCPFRRAGIHPAL